MKKVNKLIKNFVVMTFIILIVLISGTTISKAEGGVQYGVRGTVAELFVEYNSRGTLNWDTIPWLVLAGQGQSLWCNERGVAGISYGTISENLPGDSGELMITPKLDISKQVQQGVAEHWCGYDCFPSYYETWNDLLEQIPEYQKYSELKKRLEDPSMYSYCLFGGGEKTETNTVNAFIFSQGKKYESPGEVPQSGLDGDLNYAGGDFSAYEKQKAVWGEEDGGLRSLANKFLKFALDIAGKQNGYKDYIQAYKVKINQDTGKELQNEEIGGTLKENFKGEEYKSFEYKTEDINVEVNANNKDYVIGPFWIDYTVNDTTKDSYAFTNRDGYVAKFTGIDSIQVYNQEQKTIEELGGSFDIAYKYDKGIPEDQKGEVKKIIDVANGEAGGKTKGFESNKPFYIVIHRGEMKPEKLKGLYITVKLKYLKSVTAHLGYYNGLARHWKYDVASVEYERGVNVHYNCYYYTEDPNRPGVNILHDCSHDAFVTYRYNTKRFKLGWEANFTNAQDLLSLYHDENGGTSRTYKTEQILIKYLPDDDRYQEPTFELLKKCSVEDDVLRGAEFNISISAIGKNKDDKNVNFQTPKPITRITDVYGIAKITGGQLEALGLTLKGFTGKLTIIYEEKVAPAGHVKSSGTTTVSVEVNDGEIVSASGGDTTVSGDKLLVKTTMYNHHSGDTTLILRKLDRNGNPIEAGFDVHVRYTPTGGKEVDDPENIIHGQTENGIFTISGADFENMKVPIEDFGSFTGTITLEFMEMHVYASSASNTVNSFDFDITLTFEDGVEDTGKRKITQYGENTSAQVVQKYAYNVDDLLEFVNAWSASLQEYADQLPDENTANVTFELKKEMSESAWNKSQEWLNAYLGRTYGTNLNSIHAFTGDQMTVDEASQLSEALDALQDYLDEDENHIKEFTGGSNENMKFSYDWETNNSSRTINYDFEGEMPAGTWEKITKWLDEWLERVHGLSLEQIHALSEDQDMTGDEMMTLVDALGALTEYLQSDDDDIESFFKENSREQVDVNYKDAIELVMDDDMGWVSVKQHQDYTENPTAGSGGGDWGGHEEPGPFEMKLAGYVFLDDEQTKETEHNADGLLSDGETLLYGIEVRLYDDTDGGYATLMPREGKIRCNPTMTDVNGYYEFDGLDPMHEYHVEFVYNGMQYKAITDVPGAMEQPYQQPNWDRSSKGGEVDTSGRKQYNAVAPRTNVWDYNELQSIQVEIADRVHDYICKSRSYPSIEGIYSDVIANHINNDPDIEAKIDYIRNSMVKARAGYSSTNTSGKYPHTSIRSGFLTDIANINDDDGKVYFAGFEKKYLYPGQLQIHLGLVQRARTDLNLISDVMSSQITLKDYKEDYKFGTGSSQYTQYVYQEDYAYAFTRDGDNTHIYKYITDLDEEGNAINVREVEITDEEEKKGLAFYDENLNEDTEKKMQYYIDYRVTIKNSSNQDTVPIAFATYYDESLEPVEAYRIVDGEKTTKVRQANTDTYVPITDIPEGYKRVIHATDLDINTEALTNQTDAYYAEIKFKVVGKDGETPEQAFRRLINTDRENSKVSRVWDANFYSEITGYQTKDSYLDADSRPGNFDVDVFNEKLDDYRKVVYEYESNPTQELDTQLTFALDNIINAREDDAWNVELDIVDNTYRRTIRGNVWEAVTDEVKSALALQQQGYEDNTKEPLIYGDEVEGGEINPDDLNLKDIKVELVELRANGEGSSDGTQRVRAVTKTGEDGSYIFKQYMPGKYTLRFTYGDYELETNEETGEESNFPRSKVSVGDAVRKKIEEAKETGEEYEPDETDFLLLNGQYYQSTLGNPDTNNDVYWYKEKNIADVDSGRLEDMAELPNRYSDAYDDAYSRLTQMKSEIDVTQDFPDGPEGDPENPETSSSFTYQGNWEVEDGKHNDRMYAYTSTMDFRIEYIRDKVKGTNSNKWYQYSVDHIDFGITPRVSNNVVIDKNLKEFTITLTREDKYAKQKYEIVEEDGVKKIVKSGAQEGDATLLIQDPTYDNIYYKDGLVIVEMEELNMQYANMEVTYEFYIKNDSEHDDINDTEDDPTDDVVEKLTYIKEGDKIVAIKYYQEETDKMTYYENDETSNGECIVYHNNANTEDEYSKKPMKEEDGDTSLKIDDESRLGGYKRIRGYAEEEPKTVKNKAKMIADYPGLQMWLATLEDPEEGSADQSDKWEVVEKAEGAEHPYADKYIITHRALINAKEADGQDPGEDTTTLLDRQNIVLFAVDEEEGAEGETEEAAANNLMKELAPGEDAKETAVLSVNLQSGVTVLTETDYSNMVELIRLENSAGKVVDLAGYDVTGEHEKESSKRRTMTELHDGATPEDEEETTPDEEVEKIPLTPTIGTSKSETIIVQEPTGLIDFVENNIESNLSIVLIGLVILAGGIILIIKFVVPKKE